MNLGAGIAPGEPNVGTGKAWKAGGSLENREILKRTETPAEPNLEGSKKKVGGAGGRRLTQIGEEDHESSRRISTRGLEFLGSSEKLRGFEDSNKLGVPTSGLRLRESACGSCN